MQDNMVVQDRQQVFCGRLMQLMKEKNCTQSDLAAAVGVRRQTISLYCKGESKPDFVQIAAIASYFGVTSDYLIGLEDTWKRENTDIGARLGFSDEAIEKMESGADYSQLLNQLICAPAFESLVQYFNALSFMEMSKTAFADRMESESRESLEGLTGYLQHNLSELLLNVFEKCVLDNSWELSPKCVTEMKKAYSLHSDELDKQCEIALKKAERSFELYYEKNQPIVDSILDTL